jgi:uncharacterized protein YjlB
MQDARVGRPRASILRAVCEVNALFIRENGPFSNNPHWPLLMYRNAFDLSGHDPASDIEAHFKTNGWGNSWRDGVYPFNHYHSNTHEVLGCCQGSARLLFGGPQGFKLTFQAGDAVVLPAGTAHKRIDSSPDFKVVGAYPGESDYDMCYGKPEERPQTDWRIAATPLPEMDPVFGTKGGLLAHWHAPVLTH